jgi:hypothetical protein
LLIELVGNIPVIWLIQNFGTHPMKNKSVREFMKKIKIDPDKVIRVKPKMIKEGIDLNPFTKIYWFFWWARNYSEIVWLKFKSYFK